MSSIVWDKGQIRPPFCWREQLHQTHWTLSLGVRVILKSSSIVFQISKEAKKFSSFQNLTSLLPLKKL